MTVNEYFEGESLGFCICESESTERMKEFLSALKNRIGKTIRCRYFMSDDANAFYNAWIEVMCEDQNYPHKRLCTWHVNQNWTAKINTVANIPIETNGELTYRKLAKEKLFDLRSELSKSLFDQKLRDFLELLKSNELDKGNNKTRLDFICDRLLLSDKDSLKTRQKYQQVGHRNKRTSKVRSTHKEAQKLWSEDKLKVEKNHLQEYVTQYKVQENARFFAVTEMSKDASHCCSFRCKLCHACIQLFSCTCSNYRQK
jgi:hypothetical protein